MEKPKLSGGVIDDEEVEAGLMRSLNVNGSGTVKNHVFSGSEIHEKSQSTEVGLIKNHIVGGSEIDEKFIVSGSGTGAK